MISKPTTAQTLAHDAIFLILETLKQQILWEQVQNLPGGNQLKAPYAWIVGAMTCQRWWSVALQASSLWAIINIDDHFPTSAILSTILSRSNTYPLTITISSTQSSIPAYVRDLIMPSSSRLAGLVLPSISHFPTLFQSSMPSLLSLTMLGNNRASSFVAQNFPNLTTLDLSHAAQFPLPNISLWPHLVTLRLHSPTYPGGPNAVLNDFVRQIRNAKTLQELSIMGRIPMVFPEVNEDLVTPLSLTSLHLEDHRNGGAALSAFLSNFTFPFLEELSLTSIGERLHAREPMRAALLAFHPSVQHNWDNSTFPQFDSFTHLHIDYNYPAGEHLLFIMWTEDRAKENADKAIQ